MNLAEPEDRIAFKSSSVLAKWRSLWGLAPSKLWCPHVSPDIQQFGRMELMEQRNGLKEVTDHPGVLLSSMAFSSLYNPALFIPSCATQPLILHSKRPCWLFKMWVWLVVFFFHWSKKVQKSYCQFATAREKINTAPPKHPQTAQLCSASLCCFSLS